MKLNIKLNARNLSNAPTNPTYGLKIPIAHIRALAVLDSGLASHLMILATGKAATHKRRVRLLWPLRNVPPLDVHISYTYTGTTTPVGGHSSQAHIAVTDPKWTPLILAHLGGVLDAVYFQGRGRDLIVVSDA